MAVADRCALLACVGIALSACAVDGLGAAVTSVVQADGAVIVQTQEAGLLLDTRRYTAGLLLGFASTIQVLPDKDGAPRPGTYLFGAPRSSITPVAAIRRFTGLALNTNAASIGIAAGYAEDATLARVCGQASVSRSLVFYPDDPTRTKLRIQEAGQPCD